MSNKQFLSGFILILMFSCNTVSKKEYENPEKKWGEIYQDVTKQKLFETPKVFWDAMPDNLPKVILKHYSEQKQKPGFDLKKFVNENFIFPDYSKPYPKSNLPFEEYVNKEFLSLMKLPKDDDGSLIPTRMAYVSGGGMFQEFNYFRSYFAAKAFQSMGKDTLAAKMATNCFQFLQDYQYVPYGNRSYYLGFTGLPIITLLSETVVSKSPEYLQLHANLLAKDYQRWMDANEKKEGFTVLLEDGKGLNRYNSEMLSNDFFSLSKAVDWPGDTRYKISGINKVESFLSIDLNALLYHYEKSLENSFKQGKRKEYAASYTKLAEIRKSLYDKYLYNAEKGFYYDYNFVTKQQSGVATLAVVYPLLLGLSNPEQNLEIVKKLKADFLTKNGLRIEESSQVANAEMTYLAILALRKIGETGFAEELKTKWIALNRQYFSQNKHILAKYNLENPESSSLEPQRIDGALAVLICLLNE